MKRFFRSLCAVILVLCLLVSGASALTVEQALELLEYGYVRNIPAEAYEAESLEELFALLGDPYTYYMTAEEYQAFLAAVENTVDVVGIGVSVRFTEQGILVLDVLEGGSAREAGIRAGDLIVRVDGTSCVPANDSHRELLAGEEGSWTSVEVMRGGVRLGYGLERRHIVISNTEFRRKGTVGRIECSSFGSETAAAFLDIVTKWDERVDSWLVDVRGNAGGYAQAAVAVLGVFAGPGPHLYLQDGQEDLYYYEYYDVDATDRPLVVLVDGGSASASEAFAAGVRDLDLGIVVGSRTFGKGVAQVVYDGDTAPGYFEDDALKLTAYRFYSANGTTNDVMGVIPTLLVSDGLAEEVALALCGDPDGEREDLLMLQLDDQRFAVNTAETDPEVLEELLAALPPDTYVLLCEDGVEYDVTLEEGAEILGFDCGQRWFRDVSDSAFARELNTLATYGLLSGDEAGNFCPQEEMTRGELCAMLAGALNLSGEGHQVFEDVPADHPLASAISAMAEMGFVQGRGNGSFYPDQTLTQEEYFTVLSRVARYLNFYFRFEEEALTRTQLDRAAASGFAQWACRSGALMEGLGVLGACVSEVSPGAAVLREEAAAGLYELLAAAGILP